MMFPLSQSINFKTKYELFHHDHNKILTKKVNLERNQKLEMKNETRR
jgi:uncharacterized protein YlaN (UPF0358 family)